MQETENSRDAHLEMNSIRSHFIKLDGKFSLLMPEIKLSGLKLFFITFLVVTGWMKCFSQEKHKNTQNEASIEKILEKT